MIIECAHNGGRAGERHVGGPGCGTAHWGNVGHGDRAR